MAFSAAQICSSKSLAIYTNVDRATLAVDILAVAALATLICLTVIGKLDLGLGEVGTLQNKVVLALLGLGGAVTLFDGLALLIKTYAYVPSSTTPPKTSSTAPLKTPSATVLVGTPDLLANAPRDETRAFAALSSAPARTSSQPPAKPISQPETPALAAGLALNGSRGNSETDTSTAPSTALPPEPPVPLLEAPAAVVFAADPSPVGVGSSQAITEAAAPALAPQATLLTALPAAPTQQLVTALTAVSSPAAGRSSQKTEDVNVTPLATSSLTAFAPTGPAPRFEAPAAVVMLGASGPASSSGKSQEKDSPPAQAAGAAEPAAASQQLPSLLEGFYTVPGDQLKNFTHELEEARRHKGKIILSGMAVQADEQGKLQFNRGDRGKYYWIEFEYTSNGSPHHLEIYFKRAKNVTKPEVPSWADPTSTLYMESFKGVVESSQLTVMLRDLGVASWKPGTTNPPLQEIGAKGHTLKKNLDNFGPWTYAPAAKVTADTIKIFSTPGKHALYLYHDLGRWLITKDINLAMNMEQDYYQIEIAIVNGNIHFANKAKFYTYDFEKMWGHVKPCMHPWVPKHSPSIVSLKQDANLCHALKGLVFQHCEHPTFDAWCTETYRQNSEIDPKKFMESHIWLY